MSPVAPQTGTSHRPRPENGPAPGRVFHEVALRSEPLIHRIQPPSPNFHSADPSDLEPNPVSPESASKQPTGEKREERREPGLGRGRRREGPRRISNRGFFRRGACETPVIFSRFFFSPVFGKWSIRGVEPSYFIREDRFLGKANPETLPSGAGSVRQPPARRTRQPSRRGFP